MNNLDWIILGVTLTGIIAYGLYKSRTTRNLDGYFLSNRSMPWWLVLLSVMGTQASAITFLSGPGQAFSDGMRFVQYYFGLPLAMVIICITFIPVFNKLKVYTAYEYLEERFDGKTRIFTSFLFLLQRGLSTGISIYAPALILSSLFGWPIIWTNIVMGGLLIIYTVTGGARAVAYTQQLQLIIIFAGMFLAGYFVVKLLPDSVGLKDALNLGGSMGKLNVITTGMTEEGFDWKDKYNIWSGVIGGFFLALSYFGTDQSQVGRYLTAQNNTQSRLGLLMNGIVKVPMQFCILLIGALVFVFYQFNATPLTYNAKLIDELKQKGYGDSVAVLQRSFDDINKLKKETATAFTDALARDNKKDISLESDLRVLNSVSEQYRNALKQLAIRAKVESETNDNNYVFLGFVKDHLPSGVKGLLIAVIFLAAWGSIAAALNSLSSSTVVDFHKRFSKKKTTGEDDYHISRWYTLGWGVFCIIVAMFAHNVGNSLIEAVNILGSLFYGVILGIFLLAFYFKKIKANAVFWSALVVELYIILSACWPWLERKLPALFKNIPEAISSFMNSASQIGFLWLNAIGAIGVVLVAMVLNLFMKTTIVSQKVK